MKMKEQVAAIKISVISIIIDFALVIKILPTDFGCPGDISVTEFD